VSGGDKGAKAGTLAIMARGQQETVSDINEWSSHIQSSQPLSFRKTSYKFNSLLTPCKEPFATHSS
jgi:hypothetical protein